MDTIKIAFDARLLADPMFGLPRYLFDIVDALKDDPSFEITLLLNKEISHFKSERIRHKVFGPAYSKLKFVWEHMLLPGKLKEFDIFHQPNNVGVPATKGIKKVVTIHDITPLYFPETHTKMGGWYWRGALGQTLRNCDQIITVSNTVKQQIIDKFPHLNKDCITPIHNCTHALLSSVKKSSEVLGKYNLDSAPYFSYHGGYRVHKNTEIIIPAFNHIAKILPKIKLLLIGKLPDFITCAIEASPYNDRIVATGFISDEEMGELLQAAHFTLSPSFMEGFNYPPTEALSCGTLPLVSDIPINHEILGGQARYFNPDSVDDLVEKCTVLLQSAKNKVVQNGADSYLEQYSKSVFGNKYKEFYKSLM